MNRLTLILSTILVSLALFLFAQHSAWKGHLISDTDGFYFHRAAHFIENGNLKNLGTNEYQPGAVVFFLLASPLLLIDHSVDLYRSGIWGLNLGLFWLISYLLYKKTSFVPTLVFQLIVLSAGPIILYRFEFFVFLLLFASIHYLQNQKYFLSGMWLSLATLTKIFPIILIPYLLFYIIKKETLTKMLFWLWGFGVTFLVFLSLYTFITKASPTQLLNDLSIHSQKPVHAESIWATGLTWWEYAKSGEFARGKGAVGIFGIDPIYQIGSLSFYNYFWILPWVLFFGWGVWRHWNQTQNLSIDYLILVTLLFILFSKILTPQYIFWFAFLVPLLDWSKPQFNRNQIIVFLVLAINLISQYIYPLFYSELLGQFFVNGNRPNLFYSLTLRNLLLLVLWIYILATYPKPKPKSWLDLIDTVIDRFNK